MEQKMRILIADSSAEFCKELSKALTQCCNFEIVGTANDGEQAIKLVKKAQPDIFVLDLMLPKKDGLAVLQSFSGIVATKRPVVIATSAFITEYVASAAGNLGMRYLMLKPCNMDDLVKKIQEFASKRRREIPATFDMIVAKAVRDMGIPANISGYYWLIDAVKIAVVDKSATSDIVKKIYTPLANQYGITVPTREISNAITRAIMIGWDRCELHTLECYFGKDAFNTTMFPSNVDFIAVLAEEVRTVCHNRKIAVVSTKQAMIRDSAEIKELATDALYELKVPAHLKGFQYLLEAITLVVADMDLVNALSKVLYPVVAERFHTTPQRVAHAIRYAIAITWDLGDVDALFHWFGYTLNPCAGKTTNSEFIAMIADTVRRSMG